MKRIIMILTVALVMAVMMVASIMPAFAQGRGEGAQGEAVGPEGGNPGQLDKHQGREVGAQDRQPLPFGGTEPQAGFENAPPGVVCTAPGSPFHPPEGC
jgi:hypothetical protein